jgi:hypothetical protein
MIAVAVSVLAAIYLLVPSIFFDKVVSFFVPAKKFTRSRTDEILYGLTVAFIPIAAVWGCSHVCYFFGHYPFTLPTNDYSRKWDDYHSIVLALTSDSYFKEHSTDVWNAVYRAQHHQARFLFWMYTILCLQTALSVFLIRNYGRLQRFRLYKSASGFIVGRVSEWHLLLTAFLFDPSEGRVVYVDVVTPDGLYQGRIRNYFTNNDGSLIGVLLDGASRFRLKELNEARKEWKDKDPLGPKPQTKDYWTRIAGGTHLYIPAGQISNLNVRYEKPGETQKTDILRSLANQQVLKSVIQKLNKQSKTLTVTLTRTSASSKQPELTKDEFNQKAIRTETATTISYDLRPFDGKQRSAAALYLGELMFRQSIGSLKPSTKQWSAR